jgi:hypothetical protein
MKKFIAIVALLVTSVPAAAADPAKSAMLEEMFVVMRSQAPADASQMAIFERHLSDSDIRAIIAFFATPAGQHLSEATEELNKGARENLEAAIARSRQKRTMADLQTLAVAVEAHAIDHDDAYPRTMNLDGLSKAITPTYLRSMIRLDGWGKEYIYISDSRSYRVLSAGADGRLSPDAQTLNMKAGDFGDDLIFENGEFIHPRRGQ